jgi:hypothetical protein
LAALGVGSSSALAREGGPGWRDVLASDRPTLALDPPARDPGRFERQIDVRNDPDDACAGIRVVCPLICEGQTPRIDPGRLMVNYSPRGDPDLERERTPTRTGSDPATTWRSRNGPGRPGAIPTQTARRRVGGARALNKEAIRDVAIRAAPVRCPHKPNAEPRPNTFTQRPRPHERGGDRPGASPSQPPTETTHRNAALPRLREETRTPQDTGTAGSVAAAALTRP